MVCELEWHRLPTWAWFWHFDLFERRLCQKLPVSAACGRLNNYLSVIFPPPPGQGRNVMGGDKVARVGGWLAASGWITPLWRRHHQFDHAGIQPQSSQSSPRRASDGLMQMIVSR